MQAGLPQLLLVKELMVSLVEDEDSYGECGAQYCFLFIAYLLPSLLIMNEFINCYYILFFSNMIHLSRILYFHYTK